MKVETIPLELLTPDPANVRLHNPRNLDAIKRSLEAFGQQKPIVVDMTGRVVAGNGTLVAARALGWQSLKVVRTHLDGLEIEPRYVDVIVKRWEALTGDRAKRA